jgi:hypothetical protein
MFLQKPAKSGACETNNYLLVEQQLLEITVKRAFRGKNA